jgi:predicted O-methyltransferase YrrM
MDDAAWALVDAIPGWLTRPEAAMLHYLADRAKGRIVELGSFQGRSTVALAHALVAANRPGTVLAVDTFEGSPEHQPGATHFQAATVDASTGKVNTLPLLRRHLATAGLADRVEIRRDTTRGAARRFAGEVGLLFVDADHAYRAVRRDLKAWLPHCRPDAVVVLHDVGDHAGPTRAAADLLAKGFRRLDQAGSALALTRAPAGP